MSDDENPITLDDRYSSAVRSSNLRDECRRDAPLNDTDMLKAMAWSSSRLGGALRRLHSEFDAEARTGQPVRLKSLPDVREQATIQAAKWGIENPQEVAMRVIVWWLQKRCQECNGTKFEVIQGTGRQSGRACKRCRGTGESNIPCGESGKKMAVWLDSCLGYNKVSLNKWLGRGGA